MPNTTKRPNWKLFGIGLGTRLIGLLLIWLGDGSPSVFRKSLVVVGLVLMVGGIAVLRYMLLAKPLSLLSKRKTRVASPPK